GELMARQVALVGGLGDLGIDNNDRAYGMNLHQVAAAIVESPEFPASARATFMNDVLDGNGSASLRARWQDLIDDGFLDLGAETHAIHARLLREVQGRRPDELFAIGASIMGSLLVVMYFMRRTARRLATR
ncbi:MAG: hypothetical protein KDB53_14310, partial [Planctomycetes bacterium]|nr:hypothetical protein [Planctomycetota bacterium]